MDKSFITIHVSSYIYFRAFGGNTVLNLINEPNLTQNPFKEPKLQVAYEDQKSF